MPPATAVGSCAHRPNAHGGRVPRETRQPPLAQEPTRNALQDSIVFDDDEPLDPPRPETSDTPNSTASRNLFDESARWAVAAPRNCRFAAGFCRLPDPVSSRQSVRGTRRRATTKHGALAVRPRSCGRGHASVGSFDPSARQSCWPRTGDLTALMAGRGDRCIAAKTPAAHQSAPNAAVGSAALAPDGGDRFQVSCLIAAVLLAAGPARRPVAHRARKPQPPPAPSHKHTRARKSRRRPLSTTVL